MPQQVRGHTRYRLGFRESIQALGFCSPRPLVVESSAIVSAPHSMSSFLRTDSPCSVRNCQSPDFWERVKPSRVQNKPEWMTFDDQWVDEVRRAVKACAVFLWYPVYCMCPYHKRREQNLPR